jgi:hypothetical protein
MRKLAVALGLVFLLGCFGGCGTDPMPTMPHGYDGPMEWVGHYDTNGPFDQCFEDICFTVDLEIWLAKDWTCFIDLRVAGSQAWQEFETMQCTYTIDNDIYLILNGNWNFAYQDEGMGIVTGWDRFTLRLEGVDDWTYVYWMYHELWIPKV